MARTLKSKKANLMDLVIVVGVILLGFSIAILVGFKVSTELNTKFQADADIPVEGKAAFNQINDFYPGVIDNSFLLLAVGLSIVALILAMMVRIHPIFFVFYILILVIVIFICGVFSNIYLEMANSPELIDIADQLTFTTHVMYSLPFIVGIFGFLLAIVMYKNWRDTL